MIKPLPHCSERRHQLHARGNKIQWFALSSAEDSLCRREVGRWKEKKRGLFPFPLRSPPLILFLIFIGNATGASAESLCTGVFYKLLNIFEPFSFASILSKMSASVKFSGHFQWHSSEGRGGGGGGPQIFLNLARFLKIKKRKPDIFNIDQIFNNHKNDRLVLTVQTVKKIFRSCPHKPWWFRRVLSCVVMLKAFKCHSSWGCLI